MFCTCKMYGIRRLYTQSHEYAGLLLDLLSRDDVGMCSYCPRHYPHLPFPELAFLHLYV